MKDISDSKPTSEEKEKEQGGEEKEDKQEVIPPPADSAEDLEVPSSNKRKSPRKITRISVEGEEYRTSSGTMRCRSFFSNSCHFRFLCRIDLLR